MTDRNNCSVSVTLQGKTYDEVLMVVYQVDKGVFAVLGPGVAVSARLRIDRNPAMETQHCGVQFCLFAASQSKSLLSQARRGNEALVDYARVSGGTIGPIQISLSGFDAALQKAAQQP